MEKVKISIRSIDSKRNELLRTCLAVSNATLQEPGCRSSNLSQEKDNENLIYLEETWEDRTHLEEHFRSDIFTALLGAMKLLGDSSEIRINEGSGVEGLEAVQDARSKQSPEQSVSEQQ